MKNITKMLFLVSDFFSKFVKLFGFDSKRNPYTLTDHEKRKQFKKSKGGGKRRDSLPACLNHRTILQP